MSQLDSLKDCTTVVADTGDVESILYYGLQDATTNPSLILKSVKSLVYQPLFKDALDYARQKGGTRGTQIINASDKLIVNIGAKIIENIPGTVSIEVDVRLSFNSRMCIEKACKLIDLYQSIGIDKSRILIKIASTWEGIKAAEQLKKEGINSNLTLLFSFAQARACAESGVYVISPFVGRIYDWYHQHSTIQDFQIDEDPGVQFVRKIYYYYKRHSYQTIIMGASFRKVEQIIALAGCDRLTISPNLLDKLNNSNQSCTRKLCPPLTEEILLPETPLEEDEFRWEHNQDIMAVNKLSEGIRQFAVDQNQLEKLIAETL